METAFIVFSSSTTASRLKKLAAQEQIRDVAITQSPKAISQNGCTYSVKCGIKTLPALLALAKRYHLSHGHVYREIIDIQGRKTYQKL